MNVQINYIQSNKLNNSLNLKVDSYKGVDNILIDFGVNIINKAYSLFDTPDSRAKYISESFDSTFPDKSGKKWNCFIFPFESGSVGWNFYSLSEVCYSTNKELMLIFK